MNSLSQLNSLTAITFDDQRTPTVIFDRPLPMNQTVTCNQNDTHSVPVGINIVDIVVPSLASVTYTIDITSQPAATLTWASIPAGVTVTTPESGVYTLIGIDSVSDWTALKSPTFTPDATFTGVFSYTATIVWAGGSQSWTVNVTILDITNMTAADDVYYDKNDTGIIAGNPEILDNYSTNWTVTVTPSNINYVSVLSSAGTGGTSVFNTTTKVLTIKGTKTQVNTHLNLISYTITNSATQDFTLGYLAINDTTNEGDFKVQNWLTTEYLAATRANDTYSLNTQAAITNGPLITDADYDGSGTYVMTIAPTVPAAVSSMASQGKFYWAAGSQVTAAGGGYLQFAHAQNNDLTKYAVSDISTSTALGGTDGTTYGSVYVYTRSGTSLTLSNRLFATRKSNSGENNNFGEYFNATPDLTRFVISSAGEDFTGFSSWNSIETWGTGSIVEHNGGYWVAVQSSTNIEPISANSAYWSSFTPTFTPDRGAIYIMTPNSAEIQATVSGSTLTVSSVVSGTVSNGMILWKSTDTNFSNAIFIKSWSSGTLTGTVNNPGSGGGTGTYYGIAVTRILPPSNTNYFKSAQINSSGTSVAIHAQGSSGGAWVYIYDLVSGAWGLTNSFQGVSNDFGKLATNYYDQRGMVFVTDTTLVVTDPRETNNRGTVSIFTKSGGSWSLNAKITNPQAVNDSLFGKIIKVNSSTQIEVWADAADLIPTVYRKHVCNLVTGTWVLSTTTVVSHAAGEANAVLPYTTTTNGEFKVVVSKVYRNPGSGFVNYSTLSSSSDAVFQAIISGDGEYIVGHRGLSSTVKYLQVFDKTANDPNASSWNDTTKTLTLQGTREFINSEIDTIQLTPASAYNTNITLTYTLTTPRGDSDSRTQTITYTA